MGGKWIDNFNGNMVQSTPCYGGKWIHNFNGNMVEYTLLWVGSDFTTSMETSVQSTPCYGVEVNSQLQW